MCFHGNQHPSAIKHPFISLYSKYLKYICLPVVNSPVFPSLDDIYCTTKTASSFQISEESRRRKRLPDNTWIARISNSKFSKPHKSPDFERKKSARETHPSLYSLRGSMTYSNTFAQHLFSSLPPRFYCHFLDSGHKGPMSWNAEVNFWIYMIEPPQ